MKYFALVATMLLSTPALAADITIEMLNKAPEGKERNIYSEEIARVNVGDTITWLPTNKGHNIEMVAKLHIPIRAISLLVPRVNKPTCGSDALPNTAC